MAITSNKPAYFCREIVEHLGLGDTFTAVLGPEMVSRPKPDPEMIRLALGLIEQPSEAVLYVGDMRIDIETARAAGLQVCVIPSGSEARVSLEAASPDYLVDRFEEILDLVRG